MRGGDSPLAPAGRDGSATRGASDISAPSESTHVPLPEGELRVPPFQPLPHAVSSPSASSLPLSTPPLSLPLTGGARRGPWARDRDRDAPGASGGGSGGTPDDALRPPDGRRDTRFRDLLRLITPGGGVVARAETDFQRSVSLSTAAEIAGPDASVSGSITGVERGRDPWAVRTPAQLTVAEVRQLLKDYHQRLHRAGSRGGTVNAAAAVSPLGRFFHVATADDLRVSDVATLLAEAVALF